MDTKNWWESTTIKGLILTIVTIIVQQVLKITLTDADLLTISNAISAVIELIGASIAIHGRVKATTTIGSPPNGG
jgi:hypothetical protein